MRYFFIDDERTVTRVEAVRRMLAHPDNPYETDTEGRPLRRGHSYRFQAPDHTISYLPRYVRLFGRKKEQAS